ncbi:MAG: YigZ family protein [Synergistaceae bacterium]|nr:YigZ family protein [Synergistaceae bacterium]
MRSEELETQKTKSLIIPANSATYEEKIKRSVFIASVEPCDSEAEAKNFFARVISQYRDATHNCRAYIIEGIEYSSDDGEPSGTAGKPILNAIKHSELVNVAVVVTRYFGGVKLGVRGLIEAYGGTALKALEMAGRAEKILTSQIKITLEYNAMGTLTKILEASGAINLSWDYGADVNVKADVPVDEFENLVKGLAELKARKIIKSFL